MSTASELIDATYDAITTMRLFSQRLSEGEIDDNLASEMSWLLGSAKKRLEPVINLLERIENEQSRISSPADYVSGLVKDATGDFELLSEIMAVTAKFQRIRQGLEGAKS